MRLKIVEDFLETREWQRKKNDLEVEYNLGYGGVFKTFLFLPKSLCREVRWLETAYIYFEIYNGFEEKEFVNEDAYWLYTIKKQDYVGAALDGQDTNNHDRFDWKEAWVLEKGVCKR